MAPKQTDPQFKLRLTPEIKEAVEKAAAANGRSMNAEIMFRLEYSFKLRFAGMDGYSFFGERSYDDGLRMSDELNAELANAADAKGISVREEIEERLWFSMKPQNQINERLAEHLLDVNLALQQAQHELHDAQRLLSNLSPAEKLILEERAEIMESSASKVERQRAVVNLTEKSPIRNK
ncbi:Arc family DNA-binding protein [Agrobacterium pusense]|uniref:Arc family DNA-binding protein n=1 Tax=Agrobacterium pusense TaxID=648995 RepID=A0AA44ELM1_9HYPH|nr:Arc family DNA-binding protein [Agrobacterium pusense]NRF08305.1 Arc family DNA-binding protein [Agrobacterium pusense]NRF20790.1 Arc family DNA-binding protein [Agrobacterium pusense]